MFNTQEDLLANEVVLVQATGGQRFANYIIDAIIFYVIMFGLGIVLALVNPSYASSLADNDSFEFNLLDRIISLVLYALIMGAFEAATKGRTLGKYITGTKAVNEDGSVISSSTAFARGFSRAVPFCAFSALGTPCYPWQDKWTNTYVVDIKKSRLEP